MEQYHPVTQRIKVLIDKYAEGSVRKFSTLINLASSQKLNRLFNLDTRNGKYPEPSFDIIACIANMFPKTNINWLISGIGDPVINGDKSNEVVPKSIDKESVTTAPLISQYAHAGYLKGFSDNEFLEAQPLYVAKRKYSGGQYVAFEVRGDSMDDNTKQAICHGDVVLGRELYQHYWTAKLHTPKVFIVVHKYDGICIKEVVDHDLQTGVITCHSFNPNYEDFQVNLSDIMQLFYIKEISRDVE